MNNIADKIQKLLNLAGNNPNEHEAKAALLKAQELMAQYNIDMDGIQTEASIKYELTQTKVKAHTMYNNLAGIIGSSFACKVIIHDGYLSFFGRVDNAKAAASAYEFAFSVMKKGKRQAAKDHGVYHTSGQASVQNAYMLGFIRGLKEALDAQTVALAVVVPEDVKTEFDKRFQHRKNYRSTGTATAFGRSAYEAGRRDGSTVMGKRSLNA